MKSIARDKLNLTRSFMSEVYDSEDLGGFAATTPLISRKLPPSASAGPSRVANKGRAPTAVSISSDDGDIQETKAKPNKRIVRVANRTGAKRGRKQDNGSEEAEVLQSDHEKKKKRIRRGQEEIGEESESEAEIQEVPPLVQPTKRTRGSSKKPVSTSAKGEGMVNGGRGTKGKGKGKARAKAAAPVAADEIESLEIEGDDVRMGVENFENDAVLMSTKQAKRQTKQADKAADDECASLREQLRQARVHIEDLKRQMEELHQVRKTEPEVLLQRMEAQHRKQQQGSEALIGELKERLAQKDPLLRVNKNSAFELLTREEADRESQSLRDQVKSYQDAIQERDRIIKGKDEEIDTLKTSVNQLRYELQLEIDRAKSLSMQRPPDSASRRRGRLLSQNEDPKMAEVVRFYEDLTNLLVTDIKPQPARFLNQEDWLLTCVYSHRDVADTGSTSAKSLSFKLRQCYEAKPNLQGEPKNKNDLVESLQYTPLELEKESEEFVNSLGFLNNPFTYERDQLALFLRTLHDVVSGEGNDADSSEVIQFS